MKSHVYLIVAAFLGLIIASCTVRSKDSSEHATTNRETVRFATFNVSLNRKTNGELLSDLKRGEDVQIQQVAEVIQRVRPDVILLNEVDYDSQAIAIALFQKNFLAVGQNGQQPIEYPYVFTAPVNTGIESGIDINQDGQIELPSDGFGFGAFPGQYGMAVLSKYPIDSANVRTFQNFLWKDMPNARRPIDPATQKAFYSNEVFDRLRLSSKSHWDVPIQVAGETVHLICCHPTPPVFDGDEDRNGCRNHDEIRLVADYVSDNASYLYDDKGVKGGLPTGRSSFVVAGDLNADPVDGDSVQKAARQLTENPAINQTQIPASKGAVAAARITGQKNKEHQGEPAHDTGDFNDESVGNMRVDYCLPSKNLQLTDCGVFWPAEGEAGFELNQASDHHLVWIDIIVD